MEKKRLKGVDVFGIFIILIAILSFYAFTLKQMNDSIGDKLLYYIFNLILLICGFGLIKRKNFAEANPKIIVINKILKGKSKTISRNA